MPQSGSYFYPVVNKPPGTALLTKDAVQQTTALLSGAGGLLLSASDVSQWSNITVSVINGADVLGTVEVQFSPDKVNWETVDNNTFSGLAASALTSSQYVDNSRVWLRLSSSDTPATTSPVTILNMNNG